MINFYLYSPLFYLYRTFTKSPVFHIWDFVKKFKSAKISMFSEFIKNANLEPCTSGKEVAGVSALGNEGKGAKSQKTGIQFKISSIKEIQKLKSQWRMF